MKYYGIQNEVKAYINRLQDENGIFVSMNDIKTINDRVESLKRSGVWSRFSLGFNDVDGDAYLTRAGVTNPLGRCEVLWFTRGMKALDLWGSMVCWPLRSYQNAGTGSTVYSLGGGISNGTMVNSPTWGIDGITFGGDVSDHRIDTSFATTATNNLLLMSVQRRDEAGLNPISISVDPSTGARTAGLNLGSYVYIFNPGFAIASDSIAPPALGTWNTSSLVYNFTEGFVGMYNLTQRRTPITASANLTTGGLLGIGCRRGLTSGNIFGGVISFGLHMLSLRGRADYTNIRNLYKFTLGNGLPLT